MKVWEAKTNSISRGFRYQILQDGAPVSFRSFFERLCNSKEFADWYTQLLASFDADAMYWELPPLTISTIDARTEFVLIDAPVLTHLPPDPSPFSSKFRSYPEDDVVVFRNLGGDALLVVPAPRGPSETYPHLAAFLRLAETDQVRSFWRVTAETLLSHLSEEPTWLSTAGGGVCWLHLRLDSRPKYYQYQPYASTG